MIARLIRWADKVFQQSVNQPVLPYAVIVVNAMEVTVRKFHLHKLRILDFSKSLIMNLGPELELVEYRAHNKRTVEEAC